LIGGSGRNSLQSIADTANNLAAQGNAGKDIVGLFTAYGKRPAYLVRHRPREAKSLQVPLSQITDALQVYMGSVYVNDFDFNNRSYRVYVQADSNRSQPRDIRQYYCAPTPEDDFARHLGLSTKPQPSSHPALQSFRSAESWNSRGRPIVRRVSQQWKRSPSELCRME